MSCNIAVGASSFDRMNFRCAVRISSSMSEMKYRDPVGISFEKGLQTSEWTNSYGREALEEVRAFGIILTIFAFVQVEQLK